MNRKEAREVFDWMCEILEDTCSDPSVRDSVHAGYLAWCELFGRVSAHAGEEHWTSFLLPFDVFARIRGPQEAPQTSSDR